MSLSKLDAYNVQVLQAFSKADKDAEVLCTNREGRLRIFSKTEAEHSLDEWTFIANPDALLTEKIGRLGRLLQSDEEKARVAFERVRTRMASPEPLTEEEIHAFYKELFETSIASISCRQTEEAHPACLIFHLEDMWRAIELYGKDAAKPMEPRGTQGCYILAGASENKAWVFKPRDEESMQGAGIDKGDGAKREHMANVLNGDGIFPIPPTLYINIRGKIGSIQRYTHST